VLLQVQISIVGQLW